MANAQSLLKEGIQYYKLCIVPVNGM